MRPPCRGGGEGRYVPDFRLPIFNEGEGTLCAVAFLLAQSRESPCVKELAAAVIREAPRAEAAPGGRSDARSNRVSNPRRDTDSPEGAGREGRTISSGAASSPLVSPTDRKPRRKRLGKCPGPRVVGPVSARWPNREDPRKESRHGGEVVTVQVVFLDSS